MSPKKKDTKNQKDDEDQSGTGGQSGRVEFAEFIGTKDRLGDDELPPDIKRRLLDSHDRKNEASVKKQKAKRDEYKALKDGKINLHDFRQGMTQGGVSSQYKQNPILANAAQFSGIDPQVNMVPNENVADTNNEARNELEYQYRLQNRLEHAPSFNPKPQGPTG